MNKNYTTAIIVFLTVALFYYVISIYQTTVPSTKKWLIQGRIDKAVASLLATHTAAQTQNQPTN